MTLLLLPPWQSAPFLADWFIERLMPTISFTAGALVFLHFAILGPWKRCHFNVRLSPSATGCPRVCGVCVCRRLESLLRFGLPGAYTWVIGSIVQTLAYAGIPEAILGTGNWELGTANWENTTLYCRWNIHKFRRYLLISWGACSPNEVMQMPSLCRHESQFGGSLGLGSGHPLMFAQLT